MWAAVFRAGCSLCCGRFPAQPTWKLHGKNTASLFFFFFFLAPLDLCLPYLFYSWPSSASFIMHLSSCGFWKEMKSNTNIRIVYFYSELCQMLGWLYHNRLTEHTRVGFKPQCRSRGGEEGSSHQHDKILRALSATSLINVLVVSEAIEEIHGFLTGVTLWEKSWNR